MSEAIARRLLLPLLLALGLALPMFAAASASAEPVWDMKARWGDTHLAPGGKAQFVLNAKNVGTSDGSDEENLVIADTFPDGVTIENFEGGLAGLCSGEGTSVATCTIPSFFVPFVAPAPGTEPASIYAYPTGSLPQIHINVAIDPGASGEGTNVATISGGGAAKEGSDVDPVVFSSTPAGFGLAPGGWSSDVFDSPRPERNPVRQAGSHPFEYRFEFDFNQRYGIDTENNEPFTEPVSPVKDIETKLPLGMLGNPEAVPKCSAVDFASVGSVFDATGCPPDTQVGTLDIGYFNAPPEHGNPQMNPAMMTRVALYNLEPPPGVPADIGFNAAGFVLGHIYSNLEAERGYAITSLTPNISDLLIVRDLEVTFWGVPADPAHDRLRYYNGFGSNPAIGAPFGSAPIRPFLTLPMDCGEENGGTAARVTSYGNPHTFTAPKEDANPMNVTGCDDRRIRFKPDVNLQPTSKAAGGPTGLAVHLKLNQRDDRVSDATDLYEDGDAEAIATPPVKKAVVTLPEGMTLSTSAAQGLSNCSPAEIGLGNDDPVKCPESSQFGSLTLHTPLLPKDEPLNGQIYVAKQNDNPYNNFFSLYLAMEEPKRGVLVKVPGKVDLDPVTGQIKTTFDDLPQLPMTDLEMRMKGGIRAALVNPTTCGTKTIRAEFYSWHDRATPIVKNSSYEITNKADGSPCVKQLADRGFKPELKAGSVSPLAGTYSPFVFRLTRSDDDQEFSQLETVTPPGLIGKIAGLTECSDAALAAAAAPGRDGNAELASPSCPASSQIGSTDVGSGVGQVLTYIPGKVYLAGPYQGAPLSMAVITPVVSGPYDLGVIAVRAGIEVNPVTSQLTIKSEPFPQIYKGIPVRLRDIRVKVDRPDLTLNPTSCEAMSVAANVTGTGGDLFSTADDSLARLLQRFQVSNCAALGFQPKLRTRVFGGTHRGDHPRFRSELVARPGDANISRAVVTLPHSEFLDQSHIKTICTRVQYAAKNCPAGSIYGYARAITPLLDEPLEGPVYLRSSSNPLPDLVAALHGKFDVELSGRIDSINGGIRTTFDLVPDAPVTKFVLSMKGGKKGLLVNSRNLCKSVNRVKAKFGAHNAKTANQRPLLANSCGRSARAKARAASPRQSG